MGRVLAIDYGTKRVGLATTDPLQISTNVLAYQPETKIRKWLLDYISIEDVEKIIIGYPEHQDGQKTKLTDKIEILIDFIHKQNKEIQVIRFEESFTSKTAMQLMIKRGVKKNKRKEKGILDSYSALVILEEYLESII